jgi:hypothetical protein
MARSQAVDVRAQAIHEPRAFGAAEHGERGPGRGGVGGCRRGGEDVRARGVHDELHVTRGPGDEPAE